MVSYVNGSLITVKEHLIVTYVEAGNNKSVNIPNYKNYKELFIFISGDNGNGTSIYVPEIMFNNIIPFSLYSSNNTDLVQAAAYSVRAHGYYADGAIHFTRVGVYGWSSLTVSVVGLK